MVIDVSPSTLTIELTGKEDKMRALQEVLEPYGGCIPFLPFFFCVVPLCTSALLAARAGALWWVLDPGRPP